MLTLMLAAQVVVAGPPAVDPERVYAVSFLQRYGRSGPRLLESREGVIESLQRLGVAGVRLGFSWDEIEPVRGRWNWERMDSVVAELRQAGLDAFGLLMRSPRWARPAGTPDRHRPIVDGSARRGDAAFASFAARAARRYRGQIDRWEIWNEPNGPGWWIHLENGRNKGPNPIDYLSLFKEARDSILAANPEAVVLAGGLAASLGRMRWAPDPTGLSSRIRELPAYMFLRRMIRAGLRWQDISIHVYSQDPPYVRGGRRRLETFPGLVVDSVFAVLDEAGLSNARLWITEWGVKRKSGQAADYYRRWFETALTYMLCNPRVQILNVYVLHTKGDNAGYSLVDGSGALTPLGMELSNIIESPPECPR